MTNKEMTRRENRTAENQPAETPKQLVAPAIDVLENGDEYLLIADLPGVQPGDLHCEIHNGELTLRAPASAFGTGVDLFSGSSTGYEYARRFRVPSGVAADKINAKLNNGVLELHIPKEEAKKPRTIPVSVSA
jgi:HSP20 family protein